MARHGKNFSCAHCHIATRIRISGGFGPRGQTIREGRVSRASSQVAYPFCVPCRLRMQRVSRRSEAKANAFRCRQCKAITASHTEKSKTYQREKQIVELLRAGYLDSQIVRRMKCHHKTVSKLRLQVTDAKLCECGQLFYHVTKCRLRPGWQTVARERRSAFDDLLVRISRRVPASLPEEMRADICQEMLLDVMRSVDKILANLPSYISEYKRRYPLQFYSFDANPTLLERIAG
jgi:hypothetical protein